MINVNLLRTDLKTKIVRTTMFSKCCDVETMTDYEYYKLGYSYEWTSVCPKCEQSPVKDSYPVGIYKLEKIILSPKEQLLNDLKSLTRWIRRLIFIEE